MTLQEIQYKAQGIIHKWRDDDSAPYIEFVEELAHMFVPEPSEDLEEAAEKHSTDYDSTIWFVLESSNQKTIWKKEHKETFIDGAKWQKEQMMNEAVKGVLVDNVDGTQEICLHGNRYGDKVRVIVLPKEDKK